MERADGLEEGEEGQVQKRKKREKMISKQKLSRASQIFMHTRKAYV